MFSSLQEVRANIKIDSDEIVLPADLIIDSNGNEIYADIPKQIFKKHLIVFRTIYLRKKNIISKL